MNFLQRLLSRPDAGETPVMRQVRQLREISERAELEKRSSVYPPVVEPTKPKPGERIVGVRIVDAGFEDPDTGEYVSAIYHEPVQ